MGCALSSGNSEFDGFAHTSEFLVTLDELNRLKLCTEGVRKSYTVFSFLLAADDDRSTISLTTLLLRAGIPYTAFAHEIFTIFSAGRLDFRALALSIWNYCTLTIENMHLFVFDLNNTHCRPLTPSEVSNIFKDMYGEVLWRENRHTHNVTVELRQLEVLEAKFTLESFNTFMFTRMVLLVPAMQLKRSLQKVFCGRSFWREQTQNRKKLYPEHNYVSIAHLLNPDLIGLSSSGDMLISPVTSPTNASNRKRLNVKVHPESSNDTDALDISATPPAPLSTHLSIRRKQSRHSLKFFSDRRSKLDELSSNELSAGANAVTPAAHLGHGAFSEANLLNTPELMNNDTTTTDERTHRKTIRPTSAAQTPSKLRSRQRHTQLNESIVLS